MFRPEDRVQADLGLPGDDRRGVKDVAVISHGEVWVLDYRQRNGVSLSAVALPMPLVAPVTRATVSSEV